MTKNREGGKKTKNKAQKIYDICSGTTVDFNPVTLEREEKTEPKHEDGLADLILYHLESGGWNLMSTYLNSGDVVDLVDAIRAYLKREVLDLSKYFKVEDGILYVKVEDVIKLIERG